VFELKQSFSAEPVADCPECGSRSRRKFHAVPVIYKGSGFYTTDYARSSLRANGTGASSSEESESKKEKPATKAEKKDASKSSASEGKKGSGSAVSGSSRSRD
jgi:predicted nucleic acid-binding Zn ribbon protein